MTSVLIVVSSKHGATAEIGNRIGQELAVGGLHADVTSPEGAPADPSTYDALVVGSSVYAGRWSPAARRFVRRHRPLLASWPVWLFSSGPVGDIESGPHVPREVDQYVADLGARDHHVFAGKLDLARLRPWERAAVRFVHAEPGDFRDWDDVARWAARIAAELRSARAHPASRGAPSSAQ